jgi:hypothetical protein
LFLKTDGAGNLSFSSDLPTTSFTGATVETSIADSDLVLIYDDSATAVRKMTKANLVSGIGASAGQVIQVLQSFKDDVFSTTSTSYVDITGMSVSITPSSASNKILVFVFLGNVTGTDVPWVKLFRGATEIGSGSGANGVLAHTYSGGASEGEHYFGNIPSLGCILDTPATTSSTTYKVQMKNYNAGTAYINRNLSDVTAYAGRTASSITVMEVKG